MTTPNRPRLLLTQSKKKTRTTVMLKRHLFYMRKVCVYPIHGASTCNDIRKTNELDVLVVSRMALVENKQEWIRFSPLMSNNNAYTRGRVVYFTLSSLMTCTHEELAAVTRYGACAIIPLRKTAVCMSLVYVLTLGCTNQIVVMSVVITDNLIKLYL